MLSHKLKGLERSGEWCPLRGDGGAGPWQGTGAVACW